MAQFCGKRGNQLLTVFMAVFQSHGIESIFSSHQSDPFFGCCHVNQKSCSGNHTNSSSSATSTRDVLTSIYIASHLEELSDLAEGLKSSLAEALSVTFKYVLVNDSASSHKMVVTRCPESLKTVIRTLTYYQFCRHRYIISHANVYKARQITYCFRLL